MNTTQDLSPEDFRATAREAITACAGSDVATAAKQLASSGLLGVLANESVGGLGLPLSYAVPIAAEAGARLLGFPLIETLLLAHALEQSQPLLARRLVAGEVTATIATRGTVTAKRDGDGHRLDGTVDRAVLADHATHVLVRLDDGGGALIPVATSHVTTSPALSLALEAPDVALTLERAKLKQPVLVSRDQVAALFRDALILRAAAIIGAAEACLAATVAHVTHRRQFGSALVANQAVRHMLARHRLGLDGAHSAIERCFFDGDDQDLRARAAFLHACEVGTKCAEGAIQLHGGMGFTWDVPMHRHLRQIRTQGLLGGSDTLRETMAADLIDQRNSAA